MLPNNQKSPRKEVKIKMREKSFYNLIQPKSSDQESNRDDNNSGYTPDIWTITGMQEIALELGKEFSPAPEIADRLEKDLSNGAMVLFTQEEVIQAVELGLIPIEYRDDLLDLVNPNGINDIAVIPR